MLNGEKLFELAESGQVLTSKERRHCIMWVRMAHPELDNNDIANIFRVGVRTIYADLYRIRRSKTVEVKKEDIQFLVGDLKMSLERTLRDVEFSKRVAQKGSKTYLDHCKTAFELHIRYLQMLQDVGIVPKDLGTLTQNHWVLHSTVTKDIANKARPLELPAPEIEVIELGDNHKIQLAIPDEKTYTSNSNNEPVSTGSGLEKCNISVAPGPSTAT